jgi:uncharacterized protein (DUF1697 family)
MNYIALLRGINVGTGRKVQMAVLKKLCEKLGLQNVQSYIQSGNLVFSLVKPEAIPITENRLRQTFTEAFGFDIPVIVRSAEEWSALISKNPFLSEEVIEDGRLYLTCLQDEPAPESLEKIKALPYLPDRYEIIGRDVFLFCTSGYGSSKLSNSFFESKMKVQATTRNWKTVLKLHEMSLSNI